MIVIIIKDEFSVLHKFKQYHVNVFEIIVHTDVNGAYIYTTNRKSCYNEQNSERLNIN